MRETNKPSERNKVAVLSIITGEDMGLVSATLTHREPSAVEQAGATWYLLVKAKGHRVHVIGRGPQINGRKLRGIAAGMLEVSALAGDVPHIVRKPQQSEPEPYTGAKFVDFANDPVWKRIREISAGGAL